MKLNLDSEEVKTIIKLYEIHAKLNDKNNDTLEYLKSELEVCKDDSVIF